MFKNVEYGPELANNSTIRSQIEKSMPLLADVGVKPDRTRVSWNLGADDRSQPVVRLTLHDWDVDLSTQFAPDDFQKTEQLRWRYSNLWGDLLQIASHRLLDRRRDNFDESGES